jgi:two-component system response regulator RegA
VATILVLDDNPDYSTLIGRVLGKKGHKIFSFNDEEPALECIRTEKLDLAILDIKLKKMTGLEVLAELRQISPNLRVIMLTGYPTLDTARQALSLGAQEYLVKPIDINELETKVTKVLKATKRTAKEPLVL